MRDGPRNPRCLQVMMTRQEPSAPVCLLSAVARYRGTALETDFNIVLACYSAFVVPQQMLCVAEAYRLPVYRLRQLISTNWKVVTQLLSIQWTPWHDHMGLGENLKFLRTIQKARFVREGRPMRQGLRAFLRFHQETGVTQWPGVS